LQRADLTIRAIAGLIDLLVIIGLARLPDVFGYMTATGYILIRDGLLDRRSIGKRLLGLRVVSSEDPEYAASWRESIIRNVPLVVAYFLFLIPYAGWVLGPLALIAEYLAALGDEQGMRIGDLLARTRVVLDAPFSAALESGAGHQPDEARTTTIGPLDSQQ
jgi:uncharacterized RDD family membrane protein YckC